MFEYDVMTVTMSVNAYMYIHIIYYILDGGRKHAYAPKNDEIHFKIITMDIISTIAAFSSILRFGRL